MQLNLNHLARELTLTLELNEVKLLKTILQNNINNGDRKTDTVNFSEDLLKEINDLTRYNL
jgi:hypothetical protein